MLLLDGPKTQIGKMNEPPFPEYSGRGSQSSETQARDSQYQQMQARCSLQLAVRFLFQGSFAMVFAELYPV